MAAQAMNGIATVFAFTFRALVDFPDAIKVAIKDTTTDIETILIKDDPGIDGYAVSIDADGVGGTITVNDARSADYEITIYREYDETQESNYADYNSFPAETVEDGYDKGIMIDQQLTEILSRVPTLPITVYGIDLTLPIPEAGRPIGWNDAADGLTNYPSLLYQVKVDTAALPDFIGATGADGVLRVSGLLSYTDGGDFVTIGITNAAIDHDQLTNYLASEHFTMLDEDNMASDSDTQAATQQSIKKYVDDSVALQNEFVELTDTPAAYAGAALQIVRVNAAPDALEFVTLNAALVPITDSGLLYVATDVEGALAENRPLINANTLKVTNATHTGDVTGSGALTVDPTAITGKPAATVANGDLVLVADVDDSNNLKQVTAQAIANLGAGGSPITVQDEGTPLTTACTLFNFAGAGVTVTEPVADQVLVTIPGGGGGGATLELDVTQANAFSVGEWVYHNGTIWTLADASAADTAESIGVITAATGADFTVQFGGRVTGLSGLTAGQAHFLSETAGAITATAPATEGSVIKPVLIADSTTTGFIFNMRGIEVTSTTSWYQSFSNGDLSAGVLTVTHNLGHKYCQVQIYNNSDKMIMPDDITLVDANSLTVDLTSYGTLTGTWRVVVLDVGTTNSSVASDLSLAGQAAEDFAVFDGANWVAKGGVEKIKVGSFSKTMTDANGATAYTGVGFKPSYIEFTGAIGGIASVSHGASDGSNHYCSYKDNADATLDVVTTANPILIFHSASNTQRVTAVTFQSDGFTLTWSKDGTPTGTATIGYKAFR